MRNKGAHERGAGGRGGGGGNIKIMGGQMLWNLPDAWNFATTRIISAVNWDSGIRC